VTNMGKKGYNFISYV